MNLFLEYFDIKLSCCGRLRKKRKEVVGRISIYTTERTIAALDW
jgi:hypothetical protein